MKATDKINLLLKGVSMKDIQSLEAEEKKELEAEEKEKEKPEEKEKEKPEEKPDQISELLEKINTMSETLKAIQSENASNVDTEGEEAEKTSIEKADEVMNRLFGNGKEGK